MSYELQEHTADVAVEATADTIGGVFGAVADGMAAAMCDDLPDAGDLFDVTVSAENKEALLFDYLDQLIYERDVNAVLPVENETSVKHLAEDEWELSGHYTGVPLSSVTARDLKAVTYSEMDLSRTDGGWYAYVVFDV